MRVRVSHPLHMVCRGMMLSAATHGRPTGEGLVHTFCRQSARLPPTALHDSEKCGCNRQCPPHFHDHQNGCQAVQVQTRMHDHERGDPAKVVRGTTLPRDRHSLQFMVPYSMPAQVTLHTESTIVQRPYECSSGWIAQMQMTWLQRACPENLLGPQDAIRGATQSASDVSSLTTSQQNARAGIHSRSQCLASKIPSTVYFRPCRR